jgi:NAD-dependent SIR2 family protein deacetylase
MRHTHATPTTQHAKCSKCATWFPISRILEDLMNEGIIHPLDINLCPECSEIAEEEAIFEAELECIINNL